MLNHPHMTLLGLIFIPAAIAAFTVWAASPDAAHDQAHPTHHHRDGDGRAALVLIEFQKEWLGENGKLVSLFDRPQRAQAAAERARLALAAAREAGMTVIHAPMKLSPGYPELGEGKYGLRAAIPEAGTWVGEGAEFAEGFEPREGEPIARGRVGASAFVGSNLRDILEERGITRIYLMGFATHVCVESTMRHGHDLAYDVIVLRDACAAFNDEQDRYFDEHVLHHFGHAEPVEAFVAALGSEQRAEKSARHAETRFERGWRRLKRIDGEAGEKVINALEDTAPNLARYTIEFPFGDVYDPDRLDLRSREIATVAALTAMGTAEPQLKVHMHAALNVGVTRQELIAVVEQMAVYAGFPAAINGAMAAREVFEERDAE